MRKILLAAFSIMIIAGCSRTADHIDLTTFPEYENLAEYVDTDNYSTEIAEDGPGERVIIFKEDNGEVQYKSIFVKDTNRHKIVQTDGPNLFNDVIDVKE
ncbi:hypothetical protein [Jeotgalibacillus haloalkalitolerans]|uniref:DUF3139 domain-containing protein n=1 Tax=Jeotgalibacillus haloalkalitolerans TaxID=3104292 RepID=A0ABU5KHU9_9BACL|nr:hypothetical protein [Jeotgalibacillus sp. HH7-29]MDZ5710762.1 hypothetical protein [Jeotgalibacillus sp. HH7-29]